MQIAQLWRYPIKSVGGEQLDRVAVTPHGFVGDRRFGIVDRDDPERKVLTARRAPRLLLLSARWLPASDEDVEDGSVVITDDRGNELPDDEALSEWLQRPVALRRAGAEGGTYENPAEPFTETEWHTWEGPGWAWHDLTLARVSLVSEATLGDWPVQRFRSNVLLAGASAPGQEDELLGHGIGLGTSILDVTVPIDRCVMVTRPQPGFDRDLEVLRTIRRERSGKLSIGALVHRPGHVAVGDELVRMDPLPTADPATTEQP